MNKEITILIDCYDMSKPIKGNLSINNYIPQFITRLANRLNVIIICSKCNYKEFSAFKNIKIIVLTDHSSMQLIPYYKQVDLIFCFASGQVLTNVPYNLPVVTVFNETIDKTASISNVNNFDLANKEYRYHVHRSDGILVATDNEKKIIQELFGINNIKTIYFDSLCYNMKNDFNDQLKFTSKFSKYFICPISNHNHNNIYNLISAFDILNQDQNTSGQYKLVLVNLSKKSEQFELWRKKLKDCDHKADFIEVYESNSNKEFLDLLSMSKGMLLPSTLSRFTGPFFEAIKMDKPVLASKHTYISSVAGKDTAYFTDIYDPYVMAHEIKSFNEQINQEKYDVNLLKEYLLSFPEEKIIDDILGYFHEIIHKKNTFSNQTNPTIDLTILIDFKFDINKQVKLNHFPADFITMLDITTKSQCNIVGLISDVGKHKLAHANLLTDDVKNKMRFAYYRENQQSSYILALEYALNNFIHTNYFFFVTIEQFINIDLNFIQKSIVDLDYFEDIYSIKYDNSGEIPWKKEFPIYDEVLAIKEYERYMKQQKNNNMIARFYHRIIRTKSCHNNGMIGSIQSISNDISSNANIVLSY